MATTKVWNITDGSKKGVKPHNRMVLGKILKPGQAVQVDEARLASAHKVMADIEHGHLFVGDKPPAVYLAMKNPPKAQLDARLVGSDGKMQGKTAIEPGRSHGDIHGEVAKAAPAVVKNILSEAKPVEVVEAKPEAEDTPAEESTEAAESSDSSNREENRKHRKYRG